MNKIKIRHLIIRFIYFFMGLLIVSIGTNFIVASKLGADPWSIFHLGLSFHTPLSFGQVNQVVAFTIIIINLFLKIKPGIGTFLNMFSIGFFIDLTGKLQIFKTPNSVLVSWFYLIVGLVLFGTGMGVYINGQLGAGPRDSLTLALSKITGKSISFIKTLMEITVLLIGWLLGGPVGIGTLVVSLAIGHIMEWSINTFKLPKHIFVDEVKAETL